MPPPFQHCTLNDFAELLHRFSFTRQINSVHMHHTWRPNHSQYRGHDTIESMWRHHTQTNGWRDIAQHITIAPDGTIWLGRDWNLAPASAAGHNGSSFAGPFMFEMIGDFDHGRDRFEGDQKHTSLAVVALVQKRFGLAPETLRFHNQMSSKSCPGTALDYAGIVEEVRALHADPDLGASRSRGPSPFGEEALQLHQLLRSLTRPVTGAPEPADAEPSESHLGHDYSLDAGRADRSGRDGDDLLSAERLMRLRPHIVNLKEGRFSEDGLVMTTPADIDSLFDEHLAAELQAAKASGRKLRILFYAHGGLVSESNALKSASLYIPWWKDNGVYPIYFIWETGLFEILGQMLASIVGRVGRGAKRELADWTSDPVIEEAARALGAGKIWSAMKRSAERAIDSGDAAQGTIGGAFYVAQRLRAFCRKHGDEVELHAVGHSAGSIFHAYFLPAVTRDGGPRFRTVHFLAPAIRIDTFHRRLVGLLGQGIDRMTIFTMRRELELADTCGGLYRKSLLYLIHYALERERKAPILGLEVSLRADLDLRGLFGLAGSPSDVGEVIWSTSENSRSTSHGGFDDDGATMNGVARRVLGIAPGDPITQFPEGAGRGLSDWFGQFDWKPDLPPLLSDGDTPAFAPIHPAAIVHHAQPQLQPGGVGSAGSGRRRALCVGIDRYRGAPLSGCVADARLWAKTLEQIGFASPTMLIDEQATRSNILDQLRTLVGSSAAGDVVVFQFAGHGTQVPDLTGDEAGGDTPDQDEALCPFDLESGALVLDDDIAEVFAAIPSGVNVTCFIDCCHSGTISRFAVGVGSRDGGAADERPRFLIASPALIEAHRRFRETHGLRGRSRASRGPESMRQIVFSACLSNEVAWESRGHGEFTVRATGELRKGTLALNHEQFQERVVTAFGARPRQHPQLDCAPQARAAPLLQPLAGSGGGRATAGPSVAREGSVPDVLRSIAAWVEAQS